MVDNGNGMGMIPLSPGSMGAARLFVRRKFERIEFRAAERPFFASPLAKAVSLPGLVGGDRAFWQPAQDGTSARHWLTAIENLRVAPSAPIKDRPIEVELLLIDDGAAPALVHSSAPQPIELDLSRQGLKTA